MSEKPTYEDLEQKVRDLEQETIKLKQTEEALRKEKALSESLIDTARAIILVLDKNARIVSFNSYMEEISGYRLEEVKGMDWFTTFLPEHYWVLIREVFFKAINGIKTEGQINPIITKDRRELEIEWYDTTLKDEEGSIVVYYGGRFPGGRK